jgi:hypothetical protein
MSFDDWQKQNTAVKDGFSAWQSENEIGADGVTTQTPPPVTPKPLSNLTDEIITSEAVPQREPLTAESLEGLSIEEIVAREKPLRKEIGETLGIKVDKRKEAEEFRAARLTEKPAFLDELATALTRSTARTGASILEFTERQAVGSVFEPGTFESLAEPLREFSETAKVQAKEVPKDAPFREKAKVFVANAVGETVPFMAASVAATLATGTPLAAFGTSFVIEGENARQDALAEGATEQQADIEAFVVGTINGALEKMQVDEILRFSGVSKGTVKAIVDAAKERSLKNIAKKGGSLTLEVLKNSVTEGLQEALQETTSVFAPALTGREIPKEGKLKRVGMAGLGGAIVGPIFGGGVDTTQVLGQAFGEKANEIANIGQRLNESELDAQGFRTTELESAEQAQEAAEAFADIARDNDIDVQIDVIGNTLKVKELAPGEEVITQERKVPDGRQRDEERREELRLRQRPEQKELRQRPAKAKEALEAEKRQVLTEEGAVEAAPTPTAEPKVEKLRTEEPDGTIIEQTPQIRQDVSDAVEFDPEKPTTSARQAQIDEDRESLGLKEINSPTRRGWNQALKQAKSQNIPARATAIADEVNTTPRALSDVETAGMTMKMSELKSAHKQLTQDIEKAKDPADIQSLGAQIARIEQQFDNLSEAVRTSGTEKGRALAAQKLTIAEDMSLVSVLNRAKANKRADLTPKERAEFRKTIKNLEQRITAIEEARAKEAMTVANKVIKRGAKKFTTLTKAQQKATSKALGDKVNSLLEKGCNG